jgi:hypothetical protein
MPEDAEIGDRAQMGMTGSLCQQFRAPAAVAPARPSPAGLFFARVLDCRRQWPWGERAVAQQRAEQRLAARIAADVVEYRRFA